VNKCLSAPLFQAAMDVGVVVSCLKSEPFGGTHWLRKDGYPACAIISLL
jgi:hypothetical protein